MGNGSRRNDTVPPESEGQMSKHPNPDRCHCAAHSTSDCVRGSWDRAKEADIRKRIFEDRIVSLKRLKDSRVFLHDAYGIVSWKNVLLILSREIK